MKCFFDCEFTGLHKNTTLISIGIVAENGNSFYWEFLDYDKSQVDEWIEKNVLSFTYFLRENSDVEALISPNVVSNKGTKERCATELKMWFNHLGESVELVSDVSHYDMVLFCDIFGGAFKVPNSVAPTCIDINQMLADYHKTDIATAFDISREEFLSTNGVIVKGDKHNALYDAKVIKEIYNILNS